MVQALLTHKHSHIIENLDPFTWIVLDLINY